MNLFRSNLTLQNLWRALRGDRRGQIALMFALSGTVTATGVGAGVDLMRAYLIQQKLTHVAALTCQYAAASPVLATSSAAYGGVGDLLTYVANVNTFLTNTWATQQIPYALTTTVPFSSPVVGKATVTVATIVPTTFMRIANISQMPVSASADCFPATPGSSPTTPSSGAPIVQEGFELIPPPCVQGGVCYIAPNGHPSANAKVPAAPATYSASNSGYVGKNGNKWYITGYCLETDGVGLISNTVPEGSTGAELDCDNGNGTAGNSAISTQAFMEVGSYELRWFYRARVDYPNYDPTYICGSTAVDTSWANDKNTPVFWRTNAWKTNQINVYLDPPTANGAPPFHSTLAAAYSPDGAVSLAGSNLIDSCVYSPSWIERSVRIHVTTAGYYWLTFAADGDNDSFGGQIDDIRLCQGTCAGKPQDNFPTAWLPANNGGADKVLFQDNFTTPIYTDNTGAATSTLGNLNNSVGTSGTTASGWPTLPASGWATAPQNGVFYNTLGGSTSLQNVWLSNPSTTANVASRGRLMSRSFLLTPGFYSLAYDYVAESLFPSLSGIYCSATNSPPTPSSANFSALAGSGTGYLRTSPTTAISGALNTNAVGVFIGSDQMVSEPIGGGALGSTTSYSNPGTGGCANGNSQCSANSQGNNNTQSSGSTTTTSTTPTVAPDAISLTNYSLSTTSALLDICGYSSAWTTRTANFEISKSGTYWITFSTTMAGLSSYGGAAIDNVRLTALGSPAMLSPPTNAIAVPVGGVQPGSSLAFSSNTILTVADPLTFPAP